MLIGRGAERAQLDELLSEARQGRSGTLVVRGDPGIGKTALLEYAADRADGFTVLRAVGVETESDLAFSALHELLRPVLGRLEQLPEQHGAALRTALALAPPGPVDRFGVYVATLSLLGAAAEERPLLCLVDDAQWIDAASAEALVFVARRLGAEPAALVFAAREGETRTFDAPGLPELHLAPLHREAAEALVAQTQRELPAAVALRIIELSAGNPLALLELPEALSQAQRAGVEPIAEPAPIGRRVERAFLARVRSLPAEAQQALVVAAASESGDLGTIAPALGEIGVAPSALDDAERKRLVSIGDGTLRFTHPLVRSAIYGGADAVERRRAHAALAAVLRRMDGAERYAWHLAAAATAPDEEVASALELAAEAAGKRGGAAAEALAYERAARLSTDPEARARRFRAAAAVAARGGGLARVESLCREALANASDARLTGEIHKVLVTTLLWAGQLEAAYRFMTATSYELETPAPVHAAHMRARATTPLTHMLRGTEAVAAGRSAAELLARHGEEEPRVTTMLAHALVRQGAFGEGRPLAEECLAHYRRAGPPDLRWNLSDLMLLLGDHERAEELWAPVAAEARALAAFSQLAIDLEHAAALDESRGRLYPAYAAALESVQLAEQLEDEPLQLAYSVTRLATVTAALGRADEARTHVERAIELARRCSSGLLEARARAALGQLELSLAHPAAAVDELEAVARMVRGGGYGNPLFVQFSPELIEAYVQTARMDDAQAELAKLAREAAAAPTSWTLAVAARCRGLLAGEDEYAPAFDEALARHAESPRALERARTELAYGERLRRSAQRIRAREYLKRALDTFDAAGAAAWAERAREELRASGEHLRRDEAAREELTPQELQVALVVAEGATNKEAGGRLFLSPKTIEFHLRNAYRKLGVRSRTELANALRGDRTP